MKDLLDNRRGLTPQQSMQSLVRYARNQDHAIFVRKIRNLRAGNFTNIFLFGGLGYTFFSIIFGSWSEIYPDSIISMQMEAPLVKRRKFFAPEIYMKDFETWQRQLKQKQLTAIKIRPRVQQSEKGDH